MSTARKLLEEKANNAFANPAAGRGSQRREVTLIEAGWGSSGFYPEDVLRRDGPRVFKEGTFMYLNHPTPQEEAERPERNVLDRVGKLVEAPRMRGSELVSVAEIYPHWVDVIDSMADDIGLSIRAYGPTSFGEREGQKGEIVESIIEAASVDFVTEAGAGGKIGQLVEAARTENKKFLKESNNTANWFEAKIHSDFTSRADQLFADGYLTRDERIALSSAIGEALEAFNKSVAANVPQLESRALYDEPDQTLKESGPGRQTKEDNVGDDAALAKLQDEMKELKESNAKALKEAEDRAEAEKTRADRAEEANRLREAGKIVAAEVGKIEGLPSTARKRIVESALRGGDVPTMSDGRLDAALLEERARAAVQTEQRYLADLIGGDGATLDWSSSDGGGSGAVRGLNEAGGGTGGGSAKSEDDELEEVFQDMGLNESASKTAAAGR